MPVPPSLRTTTTLSLLGFGGLLIGLNVLFLHRLDRDVIDHLDRKESIRKEGYARALRLCLIEAAAVAIGTAAIWWGWDRCITRRARQIVEAAGRLHSQAPPAPPLPGGDEMGQISRALHEAHQRLNAQASELQAREERYRQMVETMPAMVFVQRGPVIEYANPAAVALMGVQSAAELVGRTPFEMLHPDCHADARENLKILRDEGAIIKAPGHQLVRRDGGIVHIDVVASTFRDERGLAIQAVAHDVSARKAAEARREALTAQLAEKNQELENLLYVASHDLRSPLVNIQGYGRLLQREWSHLGEAVHNSPHRETREAFAITKTTVPRALEYIEAGVARIDSLLEGLLRVSRLGRSAAQIEELDPRPVIEEVLKALHFQIEECGARVDIGQLPRCRADRLMLSQVFANLIDNAVKHRSPDRPCALKVTGRTQTHLVVYEFEDNGPGIPGPDQPRVFEIFGRLRPEATPGEGLGLTVVKRCLDRMEGRILLPSSAASGSTFAVELPAALIVPASPS